MNHLPPVNSRRNQIAHLLANLVLHLVADRAYRDRVGWYIRYGMNAAVRDEREGRAPPPDYRKG